MTQTQITLSILAVLLTAGIVGNLDYENELIEEALYCERLEARVHSDYNHIKDVCVARHWSK